MESAERFTSTEYEQFQGRIHTDHGQMMQGLLEDSTLILFVTCTPSKGGQNTRKGFKASVVLPCTLDVVVYGPLNMSEDIGSWFEDYDIYLQDPQTCHLEAKYLNPHRLSSANVGSCSLLSEVVSKTGTLMQLSKIQPRPDLFSTLNSSTDLEEAPQPANMTSTLQR